MACILIIEDDQRVADLLKRGLEEFGYQTMTAYDGEMGIRLFRAGNYELIITDVVLPKMNGFDVCKEVRGSDKNVPIIMLTALGTTDDKLEGFDAGADDYMVKPFDIREIDARIKALLKRKTVKNESIIKPELTYADLTIDFQTKTVYRAGREIKLTPKEFNLLSYMAQNPERLLTRVEIADKVWNTHFDTGTNFIDVYINYLRKKIDKEFDSKLIHTKPGMGFIFKSGNENKD
ncbi:MAG: response regulator transcription factor [Rikenellaceae bacterium]|nr:response regulator transcription factor [Rikenellaceae bacterium]